MEGVIAKRLGSRYEPGKRSGAWLKIKNQQRQEFVIGGWVPGEGKRSGMIGALVPVIYRAPQLSSQLRRAFAAMADVAAPEFRKVLHGENATVQAAITVDPAAPTSARDFYAAMILGDLRDTSAVDDLLAVIAKPALPAYYYEGAPADQLTVSAIEGDGSVRRFTCTDAKGYFRMDLPVQGDDSAAKAVYLQVSDADQAVLYRGDEAMTPAPGGVVYREFRLSGERLEPCPIPPDRATRPHLLDRPEAEAVAILGRLGLKVGQRLTQRAPDRVGLVISQEPAAGAPITAVEEEAEKKA